MRKIAVMLCAAAIAASLTACGGKKDGAQEVSVDTAKLAEELLTTVTTDTLSETSSDLIPSIYFLEADDVAGSAVYTSSGATACEIAVIQSKSADDTSEVEKNFQTRVDNQSSLYSTYNTAEVTRLEDAIIKSAGSYTVLCVCDDFDKAEDILKEYGF